MSMANGNGHKAPTTDPQDDAVDRIFSSARLALEPRDAAATERLSKIAADSNLFPAKNANAAYVIMQTGRELGLSSMQSLRGIFVVDGKPVLSADLLVAVVLNSGKCEAWHTIESSATKCVIETRRVGSPARRHEWTSEDAARAGLTFKDNWKKYPSAMLRHRCAADLAREVYPDVCLGLYTPEEMESVRESVPSESRADDTRGAASADAGEGLGDPDPGYERFALALAGMKRPITRAQAVSLWRDCCTTYAPQPQVRTENGDRVKKEINAATRTNPDDRKTSAFASTAAFGDAVAHAEYADTYESYSRLFGDVAGCKTADEIAAAWTGLAKELAAIPVDVQEFALVICGRLVTKVDASKKQGQAWLKVRIAELGATPPEKPTRGKDGSNATGAHADAKGEAAESTGNGDAMAMAYDASTGAVTVATPPTYAERWNAGEITPETWRGHLWEHSVEQAICASHVKHSPKFGRDKDASPFRGVTIDRLRQIGLSDLAAANALDGALKARAAKPAEKVAA